MVPTQETEKRCAALPPPAAEALDLPDFRSPARTPLMDVGLESAPTFAPKVLRKKSSEVAAAGALFVCLLGVMTLAFGAVLVVMF